MNVGGKTGWNKDRVVQPGSDNKTEWELFGGWKDRQDDERGPLTRNEGRHCMSRKTYNMWK